MRKCQKVERKQKGFPALEPVIFLLLFFFAFFLMNNGIMNVTRQNWTNAAAAAALSGGQKLIDSPNDTQAVINEALTYAMMNKSFGKPIQASQVTITLGRWGNCAFVAGGSPRSTVRVDIRRPVDALGNPTGLTSVFGRVPGPRVGLLPGPITAVAFIAYMGSNKSQAMLGEFQGRICC